MEWFMPYAELEAFNRRFNRKFSRRFNLPEGQKYKSNVLQYRKDYSGHHPTQKPVALMEDLVKTYTNPGDTVLDFTMGSGSTGVACANTGRQFIGIERDPGYFKIASDRIKAASEIAAHQQPQHLPSAPHVSDIGGTESQGCQVSDLLSIGTG